MPVALVQNKQGQIEILDMLGTGSKAQLKSKSLDELVEMHSCFAEGELLVKYTDSVYGFYKLKFIPS